MHNANTSDSTVTSGLREEEQSRQGDVSGAENGVMYREREREREFISQ